MPATINKTEFRYALHSAEQIRKKILLNYSIIGTVLFAGLVIEAVTWMSIAIAVIALFVLVYINWYGIPFSTFEKTYLRDVTDFALRPWQMLTVDHNSHLRASELIAVGLIGELPDYYSGKQLVQGKVSGTTLRISEIFMKNNKMHALHYGNNMLNLHTVLSAELAYQGEPVHLIRGTINHRTIPGYRQISLNEKTDALPENLRALADSINNYASISGNAVICSLSTAGFACAVVLPNNYRYFRPAVTKTVYDVKPAEAYRRDITFLTAMAEAGAVVCGH